MTTLLMRKTHEPSKRGRHARKVGIAFLALAVSMAGVLFAGEANAQSVKIVGIGGATCQEYLGEIRNRPDIEKNYFAWAQGYMSGLLVRAPAGKDEGLDLAPPAFPLLKQADFLRSYCSKSQSEDFSDAVNNLYRTLRAPPG